MKYYLVLLTIVLASCGNATDNTKENADATDTSTVQPVMSHADSVAEGLIYDESQDYATMYMVIPDTGKDYYKIRQKMFDIHNKTKLSIDTLGKYFDQAKQKIILPEDSEDEMYAGDYIFRRFGEDFMSIEYLSSYQERCDEHTMALVAGIFDNKNSADSLMTIITKAGFPCHVMQTEMFVGCMH